MLLHSQLRSSFSKLSGVSLGPKSPDSFFARNDMREYVCTGSYLLSWMDIKENPLKLKLMFGRFRYQLEPIPSSTDNTCIKFTYSGINSLGSTC